MTSHAELGFTVRPSSLPMLEQCPCFEGADSDDAAAGTLRHRYLHSLWSVEVNGNDGADVYDAQAISKELSPADCEGVSWALDYIKLHARLLDYPIDFERRLVSFDDAFKETLAGTPDAVCGPDVFDLKWRERDYLAQMAGYALLILDDSPLEEITFHILYGALKRVETFTLTRESAAAIVAPIVARASAPDREPRTCDYCGWCSKRLACPAFNAPAVAVAQGREDWGMQTYHCSEITAPEDMAKAILLAGRLRKWCDAVDFFKREWAIKQGVKIPGYTVRSERGDREIVDLNAALRLSGLPVEKFVQACSVSVGALKELWAEHYGISQDAADKEITARLAPVIERRPTQVVAKEKVIKERKPKNGK